MVLTFIFISCNKGRWPRAPPSCCGRCAGRGASTAWPAICDGQMGVPFAEASWTSKAIVPLEIIDCLCVYIFRYLCFLFLFDFPTTLCGIDVFDSASQVPPASSRRLLSHMDKKHLSLVFKPHSAMRATLAGACDIERRLRHETKMHVPWCPSLPNKVAWRHPRLKPAKYSTQCHKCHHGVWQMLVTNFVSNNLCKDVCD